MHSSVLSFFFNYKRKFALHGRKSLLWCVQAMIYNTRVGGQGILTKIHALNVSELVPGTLPRV